MKAYVGCAFLLAVPLVFFPINFGKDNLSVHQYFIPDCDAHSLKALVNSCETVVCSLIATATNFVSFELA